MIVFQIKWGGKRMAEIDKEEYIHNLISLVPENKISRVIEIIEHIIRECRSASPDIIEAIPYFKQFLSAEEQDIIKNIIGIYESKPFKENEFIFSMGDTIKYLYIIVEGLVKIYKHDSKNNEKILAIYSCGDIMGEMELFTDKESIVYAQPFLVNAKLLVIPQKDILELLAKIPKLYIWLIMVLSEKLEARSLEAEIHGYDMYQLVLFNLINLARILDKNKSRQNISAIITHEQIAYYAKISRSSVSEQLQILKKDNLINYTRNKLTIPNLDILEAEYKKQQGSEKNLILPY